MRCKLCDKPLKSCEIIWYPKENRHEDLCAKCREDIFMDCIKAGWDIYSMHIANSELNEVEDE